MSQPSFSLPPVPPFRLDLTVWALRRRPDNAVDRWDGQTCRRALLLPTGLDDVAVTQVEPTETPRLQVSVGGQPLRSEVKAAVTSALERLLGLRIDLAAELASQLEQWIDERTQGRVRGLRVEVTEGRVTVHGSAESYHVKQLAVQAVSARMAG